MKKTFLVLFCALVSLGAYSQSGDLSFGARGAYITYYKDFLYGLDFSYHLADPLEVNLSGMLNPSVTKKEDYMPDEKLGLYSTSLDVRYYLLLQRTWGTGPSIGGQYLFVKSKENSIYDIHAAGFNIGWHLRISLTENLKMNGGWRYTSSKDDTSHHAFYLGLCYTLNVF